MTPKKGTVVSMPPKYRMLSCGCTVDYAVSPPAIRDEVICWSCNVPATVVKIVSRQEGDRKGKGR